MNLNFLSWPYFCTLFFGPYFFQDLKQTKIFKTRIIGADGLAEISLLSLVRRNADFTIARKGTKVVSNWNKDLSYHSIKLMKFLPNNILHKT